jgi:tight adherence protein B
MLLQIIFAVFSAALLSVLAVYLILSEKLGTRHKRIRSRLDALANETAPEEEILYPILRDDKLSEIPTIDRILSKFRFSQNFQQIIDQAGLPMKAGALILGMLSLGGLMFLLALSFLHNILLALAAAFIGGVLPYLYVLRRRRKRKENFDSLLPEAIELITNALKSGFSLESALRMAAKEIPDPVGIELAVAFEEQNLGVSLTDALSNLGKRVQSEDLNLFITTLLIHKKTGGNLAEVLDKIGNTIRERFRLEKEIRIFSAQGRFSGIVLVLLPIIVTIIIWVINPTYVKILIEEKAGRYLLGTAVIMQLFGIWVISRLVKIRV